MLQTKSFGLSLHGRPLAGRLLAGPGQPLAGSKLLALTLLVALPLAALGSGCGPVLSTYLILTAQAEVDGAKAAEAEEYAPYHYTAANEYLTKAREEQGYADFGPAVEYAWKAKDLAEEARARADKAKRDLTPPQQVPTTEIDVTPTAPVNNGPAPVIIRKTDEGEN